MIKRTKRKTRRSFEYLKRMDADTLFLQYDAEQAEIPYDEFLDDVESFFDSRSSIVLMIADECCQDEEDETRVLARGGEAIDAFYDSCMSHWDDEEDGVVGMCLMKHHEMTDFRHKLCDSRHAERLVESRKRFTGKLHRS